MIIYKDVLTGDDMISDSYPFKEVGGAVFEADCAMIPEGGDDIGDNTSAEEAEEVLDDGKIYVNNIVYSFRLQPTEFDKESYMAYLKSYMRTVKSALQKRGREAEYITQFEKNAQAFIKSTLLPKFTDYEFYSGESMNPDGMVALLAYRDDGVTPYITFWKDGLEEMKV